MQRLRRAESSQRQDKEAGRREDSYAVIAFIQSDGYLKAIEEAAKRGRDEDLRELYQAKFGTQLMQTAEGTPLLSLAARNGDAGVVKELIARGADVKATNAEKWTALHCAVEAGSVQAAKMLLDSGADINAATARQGETPLMLACGLNGLGTTTGQGSKIACIRLLLKRGANVNAATKDGQTALHFAANIGSVETARLLLAQGADITLQDRKGRDALSDVIEFENVGADGKITVTQDSISQPTMKLSVMQNLVRHGYAPGLGRYINPDAEREMEASGLNAFLTIIRLLRDAENARPRDGLRCAAMPIQYKEP